MRLLFALLVAAALALTAGAARADDYATVALPAADAASSEKRRAPDLVVRAAQLETVEAIAVAALLPVVPPAAEKRQRDLVALRRQLCRAAAPDCPV